MADAISVEQANKVRLALGLKPLPVPGAGPTFKTSNADRSSSEEEEQGSTLESRQAQGYDNWKALQESADAKARREAKADAVKKARDAARKFAKLEGKGLGEADDVTEMDTKTWLLQQKKRQKKLEKEREKRRKLEEELREREANAQHTAADLAGVKVAHELNDFGEDGEQILTLKDTTIDENEEEGDELENTELKEREKLNDILELKKKKLVYNPNDADEDGTHVLLKHYDEAIDGKKRKRFTLDAHGSTVEEGRRTVGERLKAQPISLDILKDIPTSDYVDASEIKIKKPKKKKAKQTRQKAVDEDDDIFPPNGSLSTTDTKQDAMDIDGSSTAALREPRYDNISFVDDDDLQASLAKQRRQALKKRMKLTPEDLARQLQEEQSRIPDADSNDAPEEEPGLVIDETSEFVANLQRPTIPEKRQAPLKANGVARDRIMTPSAADEPEDLEMQEAYGAAVDDDEEGGAALLIPGRSSAPPPDLTITGLEDEATMNNGIGATLSLLSQRGLIAKTDTGDLNAIHRERQKFLTEKQKREAAAEQKARLQRERDRASGKLDRMSAREREEYARWENKQRDQAESRQMAEIFSREYRPDVQLKYVDEFGRSMGQKEAFKHLSHQFHGKGSGKQKTEKHLKKIADEKTREAMSSLDSSRATGMNNAVETTARKNRQAGVRLA